MRKAGIIALVLLCCLTVQAQLKGAFFTLLRQQKPTAEIGVIYSWNGIG